MDSPYVEKQRNQALSAPLFLYQEELKQELDWINNVKRAKKPSHWPVVFTKEEAKAVLLRQERTKWLMAVFYMAQVSG